MMEIAHDFRCQNPRNYSSRVYLGSCRIYIINSIAFELLKPLNAVPL